MNLTNYSNDMLQNVDMIRRLEAGEPSEKLIFISNMIQFWLIMFEMFTFP